MKYELAKVKFNGGQGAVLCNDCDTVVKEDFPLIDKKYYCSKCSQNKTDSTQNETAKNN